jgi:archaetidylinositol phosphate synthase
MARTLKGDREMSTPATLSRQKVGFRPSRRVNKSLTAGMEKRALLWMAERAPHRVSSDQLTLLGFGAQVAAGTCYALARFDRRALLLVIVCLALNWLGDSLDGTLARVRKHERPRYGFYVDHIVDVLGSVVLMCGLGCSSLLHWPVAIGMLIAFLVLSAESYLATYTLGCFQLSQGIFGPTEIRILLAIGSLAALRSPYSTVFGHRLLLFDLGGAIAAAAMSTMAITVAVRHTVELYRQEPLK